MQAKDQEPWQLQQWAEAFRWYVGWLRHAESDGRETRTLEERVRDAVNRIGARRNRQTYAGWAPCSRVIRHSGKSPETFLPPHAPPRSGPSVSNWQDPGFRDIPGPFDALAISSDGASAV